MQPRRQQQLQTSIHRALKAYHFYHLFVLKRKKHVIQQKKPFATEQLCSNSLEETLNCVRTQVSVKQNVYIHKKIYPIQYYERIHMENCLSPDNFSFLSHILSPML